MFGKSIRRAPRDEPRQNLSPRTQNCGVNASGGRKRLCLRESGTSEGLSKGRAKQRKPILAPPNGRRGSGWCDGTPPTWLPFPVISHFVDGAPAPLLRVASNRFRTLPPRRRLSSPSRQLLAPSSGQFPASALWRGEQGCEITENRVRDYGKQGAFAAKFGCENTEKWRENASNFRNLARKAREGETLLLAKGGQRVGLPRNERKPESFGRRGTPRSFSSRRPRRALANFEP